MSNRISYNFIGDAPNVDTEAFYTHICKVKPAWVVIINSLTLAKRIATTLPETNVIVRWVSNDDDPIKAWGTPDNYIAWVRQEFGGARLYANISNEAGFSDEQLQWTLDIIDRAPDLRFAVGGYCVGTPEPNDWKRPLAVELLKRLASQHQRLVLNLHEYFPALPHVFMDGVDYKNVTAWPPDIRTIKCWLLGRYQFLVKACQELELPIPRIVIGEFGADMIDQVKTWLETLIKTPPFADIKGYQTLEQQYKVWFGKHHELAYFDIIKYAEQTIYYLPQAEAICLFAWCSPASEWSRKGFDVSRALLLQSQIEGYKPVDNPVINIPAAGNYIYQGNNRVIRSTARLTGSQVGTLRANDDVTILPAKAIQADNLTWIQVVVRGSITGYIAYVPDEMKFNKPDTNEDVHNIFVEMRALVEAQRTTTIDAMRAVVNAEFDKLLVNINKLEVTMADSQERNVA